MPSYDRQTLNTPNPLARYAHRKRFAYSLSMVEQVLPEGGRLLDYGCGPGQMLQALAAERPDAELVGYDPFVDAGGGGYRQVKDTGDLDEASFDVVSALEVCEHLDATETGALFAEVKRLLKPGGGFVVSVPIMYGPVLLLKEINGILLHRRAPEYGPLEFLRALAGRPVPRGADIKGSHKGFDFRALRDRLEQDFEVESLAYSPSTARPWYLNSQVFYFCRPG